MKSRTNRLLPIIGCLLAAALLFCACAKDEGESVQQTDESLQQTDETVRTDDVSAPQTEDTQDRPNPEQDAGPVEDTTPAAPITEADALDKLQTLGFALLSDFSAPAEIPASRMFYAATGTEHAGSAKDADALQDVPAADSVLRQVGGAAPLEELIVQPTWFRRHELASMQQTFAALTGEELSDVQIRDLSADARFPWAEVSESVYYAIGYLPRAMNPAVYAIDRSDAGWKIVYTLAGEAAPGVFETGTEFADGRFVSGGILTLDAQGNVTANTVEPYRGAEAYCASLTREAELLEGERTHEILEELGQSGADVLLSQSFSDPTGLDLQQLLRLGFIRPDLHTEELRSALEQPTWGTFAACTPDQLSEQLERLTGQSPTEEQTDHLEWTYSEEHDVYYGFLTGAVFELSEASAYRRPDGSVVLAYAQLAESTQTSRCGLAILRRGGETWQVMQNVRF